MNAQLFTDLAASEEASGYPGNARALRAVPDLVRVAQEFVNQFGFHPLLDTARAALAALDATEKEIAS